MATLLVVDDDPAVRSALETSLSGDGHEVRFAAGLGEARAALGSGPADMVLLDVYLGDGHGLTLLPELVSADPDRPVLVFSGAADIPTALRAVKLGAWDFLEKPLSHARIRVAVRNALATRARTRESREHRQELLARWAFVGEGMAAVDALLRRAATANLPVLLTGETGTGKEIAARRLHLLSPRWSRPMIQVNCAAVPRELMESELFGHVRGAFTGASDRTGHLVAADGGTLLLDEIGELDPALQAKLLRVLEDGSVTRIGESTPRRVDVRIVAATHQDLPSRIREARFREDLYYRLAGLAVQLPSLRERPDDVEPLARHFLAAFCADAGLPVPEIAPSAIAELRAQAWPGNVRELRHVVQRTALLHDGGRIERFRIDGAAPERSDVAGKLADVKRELMRRHLSARLAVHAGSRSALAEELGIHANNLARLLRSAGVR